MFRFGSALFASALLSGLSGLWAADASAASCTFNNSHVELSPATAKVACTGGVAGVYSEDASGLVLHDFFDKTYTLSYKSDETTGDGSVQILDGLLDEAFSDTTWKVGNFADFGSILFGVKRANGYALFELAAEEGGWGIFKTRGDGARTNDHSHWAVWYNDPNAPAPVPLPASMVLLLLGVGSFGLTARRRMAR